MIGKVAIRRLRPHHLEALYDQKLHPTDGRKPLAPKTVLEIHLIIRGALNDAVRRGIMTRNVAFVAHAPKLRAIPKVEQQAWTAQQLQAFLREAAGHGLFPRCGSSSTSEATTSPCCATGAANAPSGSTPCSPTPKPGPALVLSGTINGALGIDVKTDYERRRQDLTWLAHRLGT